MRYDSKLGIESRMENGFSHVFRHLDVILSMAKYKFVTFSDVTVRKPEDYYYLTDRNENAIDPTSL